MESNCYMTIGPPGTGKTTRLVSKAGEAAEAWGGDKVMICSLTKTAAHEVRSRNVPLPKTSVGTVHSHCHRLLGRPEICEGHLKEWNERNPTLAVTNARTSADDSGEPVAASGGFGDRAYAQYTVHRARMTPRDNWGFYAQEFAPKWEEWKAETGYMDFEDLIDIAGRDYEHAPGKPYLIYADEAQDFSASEVNLLKKWSQGAKVVFFGDLDQTIFQFRGASPRAFYDLHIPKDHKIVLEDSHRVPRAVLERSLNWIRKVSDREDVVYRPRPEEGEVIHAPHLHFRDPATLLRDAQKHLDAGRTVMLLATCGYHLDAIIAHLRRDGIPFHNPYSSHNGRWNPLGQRSGTSSTDRMLAYLAAQEKGRWDLGDLIAWIECVSSDVLSRGAKKRVKDWEDAEHPPVITDQDVADLFDTPETQMEALSSAWQGDLSWFRRNLMSSREKPMEFPMRVYSRVGQGIKKDPQIVVGTVHSVKGGQADVVYLCPSLSRAGYENWSGSRSDRDMIYRLFYVGMTRAFQTLVLCNDLSPMQVEWN